MSNQCPEFLVIDGIGITNDCTVQFRRSAVVQLVCCFLFSSGLVWWFSMFAVACSVHTGVAWRLSEFVIACSVQVYMYSVV